MFDAFDSLLLLAKGGKMAYFGESEFRSCLVTSIRLPVPTKTAGKNSAKVLDYFAKNGAQCAPEINPAEHIVEVIQGKANSRVDWVETWSQSEERQHATAELEILNSTSKGDPSYEEDQTDFATPRWFQFKMVLQRLMTQIWRSPVCSIRHNGR